MLSSLADWFSGIGSAIKELGVTIIDGLISGIKAIFVPDTEFINEKVDYLKEQFERLGVSTYDMSSIMGKEKPLSDITCTIMGAEVTIVRMDIVDEMVLKFKAVIRGFIGLLLIAYNYDMFMGLIGQQSMQIGTHIRAISKKKDDEP